MRKILIVEDSPSISHALSIRLKNHGFSVAAAPDAISGSMHAFDKPDFVILDIMMPGGDGFLVADKIINDLKEYEIPFLFMTASRSPAIHKKAQGYGAVAVIEKPYEFAEILELINQHTKVDSDDILEIGQELEQAEEDLRKAEQALEEAIKTGNHQTVEEARQSLEDTRLKYQEVELMHAAKSIRKIS